MRARRFFSPLIVTMMSLVPSACLLFDEELAMQLEDEGAEGSEESTGAEGPSAGGLADLCMQDLVPFEPTHHPKTIDMTGFSDSYTDFTSCGMTQNVRGPEGFFALDVLAGERWHIMARPSNEENDLRVVVLSACDERACVRGTNMCGKGGAEHLNFVAPTGGTFYFVIDAAIEDDITLMAMKPPCGDGEVQHGETCDDGNTLSADGCDPSCRFELLTDGNELEPNNDVYESNVIALDAGESSRAVRGHVGGACDLDRYSITVAEGQTIRASLFDRAGAACSSAPPIELSLWAAGDVSPLASVTGADGGCPSLDGEPATQALPAGEYFVSMSAVGDESSPPLFEYQLVVEVVPTGA